MRNAEEISVYTHFMGKVEEKQVFIRGIGLGLFYGIIGNIAVSHYYGTFENLVNSRLDNLFWVNLSVLIIALIGIAIFSFKLYKQMQRLSKEKESYRQEITEILRSLVEKEKQCKATLASE